MSNPYAQAINGFLGSLEFMAPSNRRAGSRSSKKMPSSDKESNSSADRQLGILAKKAIAGIESKDESALTQIAAEIQKTAASLSSPESRNAAMMFAQMLKVFAGDGAGSQGNSDKAAANPRKKRATRKSKK